MDVLGIVADLPDFDAFLTVDEQYESTRRLAREFPERVTIDRVGQSRHGDPIEVITVGEGPLNAVLVGGGDPNEPLGCLVIDTFTRRLCKDDALRRSLGVRWHCIKCLDPDAMRRNEGWFREAITLTRYARHYFRPPESQKPEFNFPLHYKTLAFNAPLPETRALMQVLDVAQPDLFYSLHHGGVGGMFFGVSQECPPLYGPLQRIATHFKLNFLDAALLEGDAGAPLAPGIYRFAPGTKARYDALAARGVPDPAAAIPHGGVTGDVLDNEKTFKFLAEVDLVQVSRVADTTPSALRLRDMRQQTRQAAEEHEQTLFALLLSALPELQLEFSREVVAAMGAAEQAYAMANRGASSPEVSDRGEQFATEAEVFGLRVQPRIQQLCEIGMFLGLLDDEIAAGNPGEAIHGAHAVLGDRFDRMAERLEADLDYWVVPIRDLVGFQIAAGLAVVAYLRG